MNMTPTFDYVVVGGGVVGCAVFRQLCLSYSPKSVALVEAAEELLTGASGGNTGVQHCGFDSVPGSLEGRLVKRGLEMFEQLRRDTVNAPLELPARRAGAIMVAYTSEDEARLEVVEEKARRNGVMNVQRLSREEVLQREPLLRSDEKSPTGRGGGPGQGEDIRCGLLIPDEWVADSWRIPMFYVKQGIQAGGTVIRSCRVLHGTRKDGWWELDTSHAEHPLIRAACVVACCGLFSDLVETAVHRVAPDFRILPRKGQFAVLQPPVVSQAGRSSALRHIILPIPSRRTKGVLVTPTIYGYVTVGPTAEDQASRTDARCDDETIRGLVSQGVARVPGLTSHCLVSSYAGLRVASPEHDDYLISFDQGQAWAQVAGIRSTGFSSCLAIAEYVAEGVKDLAPGRETIDEAGGAVVTHALSSRFKVTHPLFALRSAL